MDDIKETFSKGLEWVKENPLYAVGGFLLLGGGSLVGIRFKGLGLFKKRQSQAQKNKARRTRLRRMKQRAYNAGRNAGRRYKRRY